MTTPTLSIQSRISKPSPKQGPIAVCIYGRPGVGKTTLLGTMPGRGLVVDIPQHEGGSFVLADHADRIDIVSIVRWDELQDLVRYLEVNQDYKWLGIDTVTAVQELAKRKTIREHDLTADPHVISMQDWGKIGMLMTEFSLAMRLLKMHVIFVAQERVRTQESGSEYAPDVSPASLATLIPPMTLVARLYTSEVIGEDGATTWARRLRVGPHPSYLTKVRALPGRGLGAVIQDPDLGQIIGYLLGANVTKPTEAVDAAFE